MVSVLLVLKDKCLGARVNRNKAHSKVVDVTTFGAKGDGVADDTKAFLRAWEAACNKDSATLHIPVDHRFLVGPLTFSGPCKSNIVFQVDGSIIVQVNPKAWTSKLVEWINFEILNGITIAGKGTLDGQGAVWWKISKLQDEVNDSRYSGSSLLSVRPTALRFYKSYDVSVQGITIQNSPKCHLKFDFCTSVKVVGVTISSPADSPNTDGIHLQDSRDVEIHHSSMACGDDCVSIQTGSSGIRIHNINCGPGHGVSIGALGEDGTKACVSNVSIYDIKIHDASNGGRIKTWQGGSGRLKSVSFSNIKVSNVRVPINIDQFYCHDKPCSNHTSAVFISDITYEKVTGTYLDTPVNLACSDDVPCTHLKFKGIELQPADRDEKSPFCWNSYGEQQSGAGCLKTGTPPNDPSLGHSPKDAC
ncbi:polygalacturonase At1g48100-like [Cryptomeria japonica]|uniref:polygalacturonase At1g48100-like n=1 Tax=Cryptomeria japonica TaxID=3369 RepID=UPI0027DAB056|nr:polygalacturonase At1g48100-like [Cryptomeria japonica]